MAKSKELKPVVVVFLIIVLGVAFVTIWANSLSPAVQSQQVYNESFSLATARIIANSSINESRTFTVLYTPTATSNLSLASFVLTNATGSVATSNTDYVVNLATGTFTYKNTTFWMNVATNQTRATYAYYDNNYVTDSTTRNIFELIVLLSTVGILIAVIAGLNLDRFKEWFKEMQESF